ncbi:MAG: hypothetical protein RLZ98_1861 [Pseudomonadota bacterium]|jgi:MFS family permease
MTAVTPSGESFRDTRILGVISVGHFISHMYFFTLPPIFLQLRDAFGVSYTELGLMMTLSFLATLVVQVPIGFMVDRYGARINLAIGLVILACCHVLMGLAPNFYSIVALSIVAGAANSVFHPADYAILNSSITPTKMGRAFSIHTFAGHLGTAAAPVAMIFLATTFGWRVALVAMGVFGLIIAVALATQWTVMREDKEDTKKNTADGKPANGILAGLQMLMSPLILIFFMFFLVLAAAVTGLSQFMIPALISMHGMSAESAATALSVFLLFSSVGVLIGGEVSDRFGRHGLVAAGVFLVTAALCALIAQWNMPLALLLAAMTIMGIGQGMIRPARDMMLRAVAPKESVGKIFGFASAGIAAGSAIAPIMFAYAVELGRPEWVFYLTAILMIAALPTVFVPAMGKKQQ